MYFILLKLLYILNMLTLQFVNGEKTHLVESKSENDNRNKVKEQEDKTVVSGEDYASPRERIYNPTGIFIMDEETGMQKNKLITIVPIIGKEFRISVDIWLQPIGKDEWQSVIHFTQGGDHPRLPAIFIGNQNRCLIHFQNLEFYCQDVFGQSYTHRWMNVEISQKLEYHHLEYQKYMYEIKINKLKAFTEENKEAREFTEVKVYAGDQWYNSANGKIRNLIISPKTYLPVRENLEMAVGLQHNRKRTVMAYMGREFEISFDMWVEPRGDDVWQSVIHFTTGGNFPRIPALFIGSENKFLIVMQNLSYDSKSVLQTHKFMHIEISQTLIDNKFIFEIQIDKNKVFSQENKNARIFQEISVYAGDPWYPAANGYIANFKYSTE